MADLKEQIESLLAERGHVDAASCDRLIEAHDVNPIVVAIEINRILESDPALRARHELARRLLERAHTAGRDDDAWLDEFSDAASEVGWTRQDLRRVLRGDAEAPAGISGAGKIERPVPDPARPAPAVSGAATTAVGDEHDRGGARDGLRIIAVAAAVLTVIAVLLIVVMDEKNEVNPVEVSAWQRAQGRDTIESYRGFIDNFPGSRYTVRAEQRIGQLEAQARAEGQRIRQDQQARLDYIRELLRRLGHAPGSGDNIDPATRAAIDEFAAAQGMQGPVAVDSGLVDRLEQRLQALEAQRWRRARASDRIEVVEDYLEDYPDGRFRDEALAHLASLEEAAARSARIEAVQRELARLGRDVEVTGREDPATRAAIEAYRRATSGDASARLDAALLEELRARERWPLEPGDTFSDCEVCPVLVLIPGGSFLMGSPEDETMRLPNEGPVHRVEVPAFAMARTEVTFAQYRHCVADGRCPYLPPDEGWGRGERPVINVSFEEAGTYARWLSERTGEHYRLPSEAEWEYAARAGSRTRFSTGECLEAGQANFDARLPSAGCPAGDFIGRTVEVGRYPPNAFGLFDMHGNVREWTRDCWNPNYAGAPSDGGAWMRGDCGRAAVRGGSWRDIEGQVRSASRVRPSGEFHNSRTGFRVVREMRQ